MSPQRQILREWPMPCVGMCSYIKTHTSMWIYIRSSEVLILVAFFWKRFIESIVPNDFFVLFVKDPRVTHETDNVWWKFGSSGPVTDCRNEWLVTGKPITAFDECRACPHPPKLHYTAERWIPVMDISPKRHQRITGRSRKACGKELFPTRVDWSDRALGGFSCTAREQQSVLPSQTERLRLETTSELHSVASGEFMLLIKELVCRKWMNLMFLFGCLYGCVTEQTLTTWKTVISICCTLWS